MTESTFIVDCPFCKAKVAATVKGCAERTFFSDEIGEPVGERLSVGVCPHCNSILVGESYQTHFAEWDSDVDRWSAFVRVYPKPPKSFSSPRIPRVVKHSLLEAERCLQVNANIAACVMLGRALEAVCRDILQTTKPEDHEQSGASKRNLMLAKGINALRDMQIIDNRLYEWSQQLHAFRNLAAHPEDISISRADAEDLQSFVYAIVEYIYDLTDRYNEFKSRLKTHPKLKKPSAKKQSKAVTDSPVSPLKPEACDN